MAMVAGETAAAAGEQEEGGDTTVAVAAGLVRDRAAELAMRREILELARGKAAGSPTLTELPEEEALALLLSQELHCVWRDRESGARIFVGGQFEAPTVEGEPVHQDDGSDSGGVVFDLVVDAHGDSGRDEYPYRGWLQGSGGRAKLLRLELNTEADTPEGCRPIVGVHAFAPERLNPVLAAIDQSVADGEAILVHCAQGKDRSVSCVSAYLCVRFGVSVPDAVSSIRATRQIANPIDEKERGLSYRAKLEAGLAAGTYSIGKRGLGALTEQERSEEQLAVNGAEEDPQTHVQAEDEDEGDGAGAGEGEGKVVEVEPPLPPTTGMEGPTGVDGPTQECLLCGAVFGGESRNTSFPMCVACYRQAFQADMSVARVLQFQPATHVVDHVWVGPEGATVSLEWLREQSITRVLCVAGHCDHLNRFEGIEYMTIPLDDDPQEAILQHFDQGLAFLTARRDTNVLLHCISGISRSGTFACAYLMREKGMSLDDALAFARSQRPEISPNRGFMRQLQEYAAELAASGGGRGGEGVGPEAEAVADTETEAAS